MFGVCLFLFFLSFVFLSFQGLESLIFSFLFLSFQDLENFILFLLSSWSYFSYSFSFLLFKALRASFLLSFFPVHDIYSLQFYVLSQEYTKNTLIHSNQRVKCDFCCCFICLFVLSSSVIQYLRILSMLIDKRLPFILIIIMLCYSLSCCFFPMCRHAYTHIHIYTYTTHTHMVT